MWDVADNKPLQPVTVAYFSHLYCCASCYDNVSMVIVHLVGKLDYYLCTQEIINCHDCAFYCYVTAGSANDKAWVMESNKIYTPKV